MIYRILEKLNNFSMLSTIFVVTLCVVIYATISIIGNDKSPLSEMKYFNATIFVILFLVVLNILFTWYAAQKTKKKRGAIGTPGIQGQKGKTGTKANCNLDCGKRVCYGSIKDSINVHFNTQLKNKKEYLDEMIQNDIYAGHIKYQGESTLVKLRYRRAYQNAELRGNNKKIQEIEVYPDYEFIINRDNEKIKLIAGKYDVIKLSNKNIEIGDIDENTITSIDINTFINNRYFLNKINNLCHSENYQQILRRKGKTKVNEHKLITYMSDTIKVWVNELVSFSVRLGRVILFPGIRFLREANFTENMLKDYKKIRSVRGENIRMPVDSPFTKYDVSNSGEIIEEDGEIKKYDLWKWGEEYSLTPINIKKCFRKTNLPLGDDPKLYIIKTNSYRLLYNSSINKDKYNTVICPFNQMGLDGTNPNNLTHCKQLDSSTGMLDVKKLSPVWKEKKIIDFKKEISLYHPQFSDGKYYFEDPKSKRKYFPVGSVWRGKKTSKPPNNKKYLPSVGGSCGNHNKSGPQKETILVSGDVKTPTGYRLIWNSEDRIEKDSNSTPVNRTGANFYSGLNENGTSFEVTEGTRQVRESVNSITINQNFRATVERNTLGVQSTETLEPGNHNLVFPEGVPPQFQFELDPITPGNVFNHIPNNNEYGLGDFGYLKNTNNIPTFGIRSAQQTEDGIVYKYLTVDSALMKNNALYNDFFDKDWDRGGHGYPVYFPQRYTIDDQRVNQGYTADVENVGRDGATGHITDGVILYEHGCFRGQHRSFKEGEYDGSYIHSVLRFGDVTSSLVVLPGFEAELNEHFLTGNTGLTTTYKAGVYPWVECGDGSRERPYFHNDVLSSLKVRRVNNRVTVKPTQLWSFVQHTSGNDVYYIQNPIINKMNRTFTADEKRKRKLVSLSAVGCNRSYFDRRNDRTQYVDYTQTPSVTRYYDMGAEIWKLERLTNGKYAIRLNNNPRLYLFCNGNTFGLMNAPTFQSTITSFELKYYPATIISIKSAINDTFCTDNGLNLKLTCNTNKNNVSTHEKFIINYRLEQNSITLKGQNSNRYAVMEDGYVKFKANDLRGTSGISPSLFKLYRNNGTTLTDNTLEIYNSLTKSQEEIMVLLYFNDRQLGLDRNGDLTYRNNYTFVVKKHQPSSDLQPSTNSAVSVWRPIPPAGYVAMGDYVMENQYDQNSTLVEPEVFDDSTTPLHELNNGRGPPVVCLPSSCLEKIDSLPAWHNSGGIVEIFNSYQGYVTQSPIRTVKQKDVYLWTAGLSNSGEENVNRPEQDFEDDGGYNLFRAKITPGQPDSIDAAAYKIRSKCLRKTIPRQIEPDIKDTLSVINDRANYQKSNGYFDLPQNAYIERVVNNPNTYYSDKPKSYYIEYVKRDTPNQTQLDGLEHPEDALGNPLYFIKVNNTAKNDFSGCLGVNETGDIVRSNVCNRSNKNHLWRIKNNNNNDDNSSLNLNSDSINNTQINMHSANENLPNDKFCFKQEFDEQGNLSETLESCDYQNLGWKYKSLSLSDLTYD